MKTKHAVCKQLVGSGCCGCLSTIGPHKLIGNGTVGRLGFVGGSMASLEKVCHREGGL